MSLDTIATGSTILLDANILVYARKRQSPECERLLERCGHGELRGILPTHTLAEVSHVLMTLEARERAGSLHGYGHRALLEKPAEIQKFEEHAKAVHKLLSSDIHIESLLKEDFPIALEFQKQWGLLTNDALLLAVGSRLSVNMLASADKGFRMATRWKLYAPSDLK